MKKLHWTDSEFDRTYFLFSFYFFLYLIVCRSYAILELHARNDDYDDDVPPVQNLLLCTKFHRNRMIFHSYMAIYRFSKWRPSAMLELFYHHTIPPTKSLFWPQLPVKFHVNLIHRSEDNYLIFCIFGLKCLSRPPKWGFWGTLDP